MQNTAEVGLKQKNEQKNPARNIRSLCPKMLDLANTSKWLLHKCAKTLKKSC